MAANEESVLTHLLSLSTAIEKQIMESREKALQTLKSILELERAPLFTQNDHYLEDARRKWLARYREARMNSYMYSCPPPAPVPPVAPMPGDEDQEVSAGMKRVSLEQSALQSLVDHGYRGIHREDLKCLHPHEDFENELVVMADVRAYFQVAYKVRMNPRGIAQQSAHISSSNRGSSIISH
jgi:vacuolar protein sorting-associated protein 1